MSRQASRIRHVEPILAPLVLAICILFSSLFLEVEGSVYKHYDMVSRRDVITRPPWKTPELSFRGGTSSEDDEYDEENTNDDVDEEEDDDTEQVAKNAENGENAALNVSKNALKLLGRASIATVLGLKRAVQAAFSRDDTEESEEGPSAFVKVFRTLSRMWKAAINPGHENDNTTKKSTRRDDETQAEEPEKMSDFGDYLAKSYNVKGVERGDSFVLGGTIGDALREARAKARLLVVCVPAFPPNNKSDFDQAVIKSLLSKDVSNVAEKRAKKKIDSGSFVLWGAKTGSPEAVTAIKRLKAKQQGSKKGKRPILLVAYPAAVTNSAGVPKLVPRLLAQHHCSPPPSSESIAAWLNALRKRHSKQYNTMQKALQEKQYLKERQEGYRDSVVSDKERRRRQQREEQERLAQEAAEQQRQEEIRQRRLELNESLPEEPDKQSLNVMTIALRFPDGRSGQRRFSNDTPMAMVFNWVDAHYELERETVTLTTMNGQKSFSWEEADDVTLAETGLGRMTGLRVIEKKKEEEPEEADDKESTKA